MIRTLLVAACLAMGLQTAAGTTPAATAVNVTPDGVAIGGFDPVAYFSEGRAVEGREDLAHIWQGARWLFASPEHRDRFAAAPEAYAPQFGGWCAFALSRGRYAAEVDPAQAWTVQDGQLFLNWSPGVRDRWLDDDDAIATGRGNWPHVEAAILDGTVRYSRKPDSPWN